MNDITIENGINSALGSDGMHYPYLKYDIAGGLITKNMVCSRNYFSTSITLHSML